MRHVSLPIMAVIVSTTTSCSREIDVSKDTCAVKTRMGEITEVIHGPGTVELAFGIDSIKIFPINQRIDFSTAEGSSVIMKFTVTDPKLFYGLALGRADIMEEYFKNKLIKLSPDKAAALLMQELNKEGTGVKIETEILREE